jgi:hypothetical protein
LPWKHTRANKTSHELPVLGHDQECLNDAKWYVLPPTKYIQFLTDVMYEQPSPDSLWFILHHLKSIIPSNIEHIQRVFNTHYASDWSHLTKFISTDIQKFVPVSFPAPLTDNVDLSVVKVFWVTIHMLLSGFRDLNQLLPQADIHHSFIEDTCYAYVNIHDALFNEHTTPVVVRDNVNRQVDTLISSFLLSDVFLPSTGGPVASWYESLVSIAPNMDVHYLQRVQQKHPNTINNVNAINNSQRKRKIHGSTVVSPAHRIINQQPFVDVTKQPTPYSPGKKTNTPRNPLYDPSEPSLDALANLPSSKRKQALHSPHHQPIRTDSTNFLNATK